MGYEDAYRGYAGAMEDSAGRFEGDRGRYDSWVNNGITSRDQNRGEYNRSILNPNSVQDQVAAGYQESPYQRMLLDRTQKRMNYNAMQTGMGGSGAFNRALQDEMLGMSGQFQNQYIDRGMNTYNRALQGNDLWGQVGFQGLERQDALRALAEQQRSEAAAANLKGDMAASDEEAQDSGSMWGSILGIAGGVVGAIYGGPMGASAGYAIGSGVGGAIDGNGGGGGGGQGGGGGGGGGGGMNPMSMMGGMMGGGGATTGNYGGSAMGGGMAGQAQIPIPYT